MRILTLTCILFLCTSCTQVINEKWNEGYLVEKTQYQEWFTTRDLRGLIYKDLLIEETRAVPSDVKVITPYGTVGVEK